jgi:hypothetical protein
MTPSEFTPLAPLDIEFPLRTRAEDTTGESSSVADATNAAIERLTAVASTPRPPLTFLAERLLSASGPFGLEVEIKSEERVVGTWNIEVNPRGVGEAYVSQAKADLYVCGSARSDLRATGAFLVIRQWWVCVSDRQQLEQLYECLSAAALERLDSLLGVVPNETGESRACVLFLVDGRRLDRKLFSLDRLQIRILEDLETDHAIAGLDMRVAHGRGTGTRPHAVFTSTLPALLAGESEPAALSAARASLIGEVFIRETVSTENLRWNRRASDRARAMLRPEEAPAARQAGLPAIAARVTTDDAQVPVRELTSTH